MPLTIGKGTRHSSIQARYCDKVKLTILKDEMNDQEFKNTEIQVQRQ